MSRFLAIAALLFLSACTARGAIAPGDEVTLGVGQAVPLPDATRLRYLGIANDSRCPRDVQCIRAGDADVLFDLGADRAASRIVLNTERRTSAHVRAWRLQLLDLAPGASPAATIRIDSLQGDPP